MVKKSNRALINNPISKEEKLKILKRQSPELFPLLAEVKIYSSLLKEVYEPLQKLVNEEGKDSKVYTECLVTI